ncbi:putative serine aminopeptidase, S33, alpha/Beta hydrolase [Dioscorea sansibarensis]
MLCVFLRVLPFLEKLLTENPGLPCFCFGHSTGAAIVLKVVLDPNIESCVQGVVLTSPAVKVQPSHPLAVLLVWWAETSSGVGGVKLLTIAILIQKDKVI